MAEGPGEHVDELPEELDVTGYVGRYTFPDIRRRRVPGLIYLGVGLVAIVLAHLEGMHPHERED